MRANDIKKIALYGGGTIGSGFAAYFALKGLSVGIFEKTEDSAEYAKRTIQKPIQSFLSLGLIRDEAEILERVYITTDPEEAFFEAQFVQENGPESVDAKQEIVALLEQYLAADALIISSSSGIPATEIAARAHHPERIMVGHPFNPVYLIPLIEISGGEKTAQRSIELAEEFYRMYGKVPVIMKKEKRGFIANRLAHALWREELSLVSEGVCTLKDADNAFCFGPGLRYAAMGPALNYDLAGAKDGLKGVIEKFGTTSDLIFEDLSNLKKTPIGFAEQAGAQMPGYRESLPEHMGKNAEEIAYFRDKLIVELLKMHSLL